MWIPGSGRTSSPGMTLKNRASCPGMTLKGEGERWSRNDSGGELCRNDARVSPKMTLKKSSEWRNGVEKGGASGGGKKFFLFLVIKFKKMLKKFLTLFLFCSI